MAPTTNPGSRPKTNPGRRKAHADVSEDTDASGGRSSKSLMPGEDELTSDPITSDGLGMHDDLGMPHEEHDVESLESRPLALQRALRQVEAVVDAEFVAAMEKLESLGRNEEELQSRLEELYLELGTVQDSLAETSRAARAALVHRAETYTRRTDMQATVIHRTLRTDAEELESRQRVWNQRNESAEARLRALKEDPTLADKISEFRQLDTRMDTLELLPESYRGVVKAHHTELKTKLKDHLEEPKNDPLKPIDISVAVSIAGGRRPEGGDAVPARLLAVLPVDFDTHQRAREGANDLTARFAFRVLAAPVPVRREHRRARSARTGRSGRAAGDRAALRRFGYPRDGPLIWRALCAIPMPTRETLE